MRYNKMNNRNKKEVKLMGAEPITLQKFTCERCGHSWIPRSEERPRSCPNPKCRSIYWDKPKKPSDEDNGKQ